MNCREKIKKAIECPQFGNEGYGEWGALRLEQRVLIKRLLNELDNADNCVKRLYEENEELKKQLEELTNENNILDTKINKYIEQKDEWVELISKYETQQQKFIAYLTSYIELLNNKPDLVEEGQEDILEEVLTKYKEIIGSDINVGSKGVKKWTMIH